MVTKQDAPKTYNLRAQRLDEVEAQPIPWLYPDHLALGKLHCLYGSGGVGKTTVAIDWMATVTSGGLWPDGSAVAAVGSAAIMTGEDGVEDTILPRVLAAGGERNRITVIDPYLEESDGSTQFFNLLDPSAIAALKEKLEGIPDLKILVVDPITAFMGRAGSHAINAVRKALHPLSKMADDLSIAVIFVHHVNKMVGQNAVHRASGSTAFIDVVRIAMIAYEYEDDLKRCRVETVKSNLSPMPPAIDYILEEVPEVGAAKIVWLGKAKDSTPAVAKSQRIGQTPAEQYLLAALSEGPRTTVALKAEAITRGITRKQLRTARENLGVISYAQGFGSDKQQFWSLNNAHACP